MALITNSTTSGTINTATDAIADLNGHSGVVFQNQHATADIYVNIGANAVSTGTVAGVLVPAKTSVILPVYGARLSTASGTASVPYAFFPYITD